MPIDWSGTADVKVKEFNEQHQTIINLFYDLNQTIISNKAYEKIEGILIDLVGYADYHFRSEEKYFKDYNFPLARDHVAEHEVFRRMIKELHNNLNANELKSSLILISFLEQWINNHIIGTDSKYGEFFNQRGMF